MNKRKQIQIVIQSEEDEFKTQFNSWLNNSHYWEEETRQKMLPISVCKWCGSVQPMESDRSTLCMKNPEIIKILRKQEEITKNILNE